MCKITVIFPLYVQSYGFIKLYKKTESLYKKLSDLLLFVVLVHILLTEIILLHWSW